jgi:glycosyltransferase involved in cell wall biosynthesis
VATTDISIRHLLAPQIAALEEAGHEVTAVCAAGAEVPGLLEQGVKVEHVAFKRELDVLPDLRSVIDLVRLFRRRRYDAVITHTPKAGLIGPLAAQLAGVPLVVHTVHGFLFHDRMRPSRRLLGLAAEMFTSAFSDYLFFQSMEDLRTAGRYHMKRSRRLMYVGNGIDTTRFGPQEPSVRAAARAEAGIAPDAFVVATVGRLVWEKGYREFLAAAETLAARHRDMTFLIVGPTEQDQADGLTAADVEELGQRPHVRYFGFRNDLPKLYSAMDVFVLASHREGIPRCVLEASSMEVPIVASEIRGCREAVSDGITGLLFPMGDVEALVEAVEELYQDRPRAARMGRAGRDFVKERFDEEIMLTRLRACIGELLAPAGSDR